jgi:hypothetical protein
VTDSLAEAKAAFGAAGERQHPLSQGRSGPDLQITAVLGTGYRQAPTENALALRTKWVRRDTNLYGLSDFIASGLALDRAAVALLGWRMLMPVPSGSAREPEKDEQRRISKIDRRPALNDQLSKIESQPESGDTETMSTLHNKSDDPFETITNRLSDIGDAASLILNLINSIYFTSIILPFLISILIYIHYRTFVNIGGIWGHFAVFGHLLVHLALIVAAFVGYIVSFVILHLIVSIGTGTRLRPVQIFISFQHDYESIAAEIEKGLGDRDIQVIRLPFRFGRDHDEVIKESLRAVKAADAVVVVPGPTLSWMATELGLAVGSNKPIAVIKHLPDQGLSDSLYRGYPVFTWDRLHTNGLAPLRRFLAFATKAPSDIWPQFERSTEGFLELMLASFGILVFVISPLLKLVTCFTWAFAPRTAEVIAAGQLFWVYFAYIAIIFAFAFIVVFYHRVRGLAVARQKILTRDATLEEFSRVFSLLDADRAILSALERAPLEPRHKET